MLKIVEVLGTSWGIGGLIYDYLTGSVWWAWMIDAGFLVAGIEYSCAATPQIRQTGNRLSGLAETAYASLLAQCFV